MLVFDSFGQIGTWRRWKCDPKLSWYESMMGQDQLCQKFRKCHHLGPRYDFFTKRISDLLLTRQSNIYIYTYILLQYLKLPEATGWTLSLLRSPAADLSKGSKPIVSAGRGVGRGLFAPQKSGNSDFMENRLMTEGAELASIISNSLVCSLA